MKQIFDKHQRYRVDLIEENQSTGENKHAPVIICLFFFCILPLKSSKGPRCKLYIAIDR